MSILDRAGYADIGSSAGFHDPFPSPPKSQDRPSLQLVQGRAVWCVLLVLVPRRHPCERWVIVGERQEKVKDMRVARQRVEEGQDYIRGSRRRAMPDGLNHADRWQNPDHISGPTPSAGEGWSSTSPARCGACRKGRSRGACHAASCRGRRSRRGSGRSPAPPARRGPRAEVAPTAPR
jgi:hypothetical protein